MILSAPLPDDNRDLCFVDDTLVNEVSPRHYS